MGVPLAHAVGATAMLFERALSGVDRGIDLVGDIALVGAPLQEIDAVLAVEVVGEPQGAFEVRRGLPVRAESRGALTGSRGVVE